MPLSPPAPRAAAGGSRSSPSLGPTGWPCTRSAAMRRCVSPRRTRQATRLTSPMRNRPPTCGTTRRRPLSASCLSRSRTHAGSSPRPAGQPWSSPSSRPSAGGPAPGGGARRGAPARSRAPAPPATAAAVRDAALRQAGVVGVRTGLQVLDAARALSGQPAPHGRRVAVMTNSGGTGVELADLLADEALDEPELSASLQAELGALLPGY